MLPESDARQRPGSSISRPGRTHSSHFFIKNRKQTRRHAPRVVARERFVAARRCGPSLKYNIREPPSRWTCVYSKYVIDNISKSFGSGLIMDVQKGIYEFIIATMPAVVLYFIGWSYLYFYLGSFGINISELKLDLQTIFIYSYSPVRTLISVLLSHWLSLALSLVLAGILFMVARRFFPAKLARRISHLVNERKAAWSSRLPESPIMRALIFILALVVVAPVVLVPWARWAATMAASRVWTGVAQEIVAVVSEKDYVDDKDQGASWLSSYRQCQNRVELGLIFSDDQAYYMLCRSQDDPKTGLVFEVRRKGRLASVRYLDRGDVK